MDKQAREAREMAKNLPFKERVKHFWNYYKWHVIVITAVVALVAGSLYECATRETYDLEISYYGNTYVTDEQVAAMEAYFAQFVQDVNGDGKQTVKVYANSMAMMGDNPEANMAMQSKFMAELAAGASAGYVFDQDYKEVMTGESYDGTMESFYEMTANPALKEAMQLPDEPLFWAVRSLYEKDQDKAESIAAHDNALRIRQGLETAN